MYCTIFFDSFFNSPSFVITLFDKGLYRIATTRMDRKGIPKMKPEVITNISLLTNLLAVNGLISDESQCCSVTFLAYNQHNFFNCEWKDQPQKNPVSCPDIIKMYNQGMGGVDLVDQRIAAYHLDRKSSITCYVLNLFDLMVSKLVSTPSWFTIWWIRTTLPCLITKQSSHTIWLVGTKVAAKHHQNKKLDQRGNISTIFNLLICNRIYMNFSTAKNILNTARKKYLTEKLSWNELSVVHFCAL